MLAGIAVDVALDLPILPAAAVMLVGALASMAWLRGAPTPERQSQAY